MTEIGDDATNVKTFRRFKEYQPIQLGELEPFGICESDTSAKVIGSSVRNYNQFMLQKPKKPWIAKLTDTPSRLLKSSSEISVSLLQKELTARSSLIGQPLKEMDPYYFGRSDTYVTVTGDGYLYRFSSTPSLGMFKPDSETRKAAISVACSSYFQAFIIAVIVLDFVALILSAGSDAFVVLGSDLFFGVYTSEMIIKMIAFGLIMGDHTYLRSFYGWIELVVIVSNVVSLLVSDAEVLAQLRVIRVVRLVRVLATLKYTRKILEALVNSLDELVPVFTLLLITISFVSLISLVFFSGVLLGKCVKSPDFNASTIEDYKNWTENKEHWLEGPWGERRCPLIGARRSSILALIDDRALRACPENYICHISHTGNPDNGFTNYDTLLLSILTTFRLLCQDWWDNLYVQLSLVSGGHIATLYFLFVIFVASNFLINLLLSTVTLAYQHNEEAAKSGEEDQIKLAVIMEVNRNSAYRRQVEVYNILAASGNRHLPEPWFLRNLNEKPIKNFNNFESLANTLKNVYESPTNQQLLSFSNPNVAVKQPNFFIYVKRFFKSFACDRENQLKPLDSVSSSIIFMNIIEMLMAAPPLEHMIYVSEVTNICYTVIFTIEATVELSCTGINYLHGVVNQFDIFIAVMCIIELVIPGSNSKMLIVLRMLRLLRLLKLARISTELEKLMTVTIRAFLSELSLILLSVTVILISAGIGMVLFQETYIKYKEYQKPTLNFVDFFNSILVVFRIMCGEWIENMWVCMAIMETPIRKTFCVAYFLLNQIVVSLVIFQLYIGILLNKFSEHRASVENESRNVDKGEKEAEPSSFFKGIACIRYCIQRKKRQPSQKSCFGRLRLAVRNIICSNHGLFPTFVIIMTILSSVALLLDDYYLKEDKELTELYKHFEIIFLVFFAIEFLLKLFAYGPLVYFFSMWRVLDSIIVAVTILDFAVGYLANSPDFNIAALRVFRTLRCLRILRTANVWEGFKLSINALFSSMKKLLFVVFIVLIVWIMFALISTSLFSKKFHRCENDDGSVVSRDVVTNKTQCLSRNLTWSGKLINFDTVPSAMLALLEIAVFKGWTNIFQDVSNAPTQIDQQPAIDSNSSAYLLIYIAFIFIGSFFMLGMLVGVIVDSFEEERQDLNKKVVTKGQQKLQNSMLHCLMFPIRTYKPVPDNVIGAIFKKLHSIVYVELFYLVLILAGTVAMALQYHPGNRPMNRVYLPLIDDAILLLFGLELVTRILAEDTLYFVPFFGWNLLDFMIVAFSIAAKINEQSVELQYLRIIRFARVFRMGRLLTKFSNIKVVRNILLTVIVALPSMLNIISLLILTICVFAIVGVSLFNDIKDNDKHPFNEMFNFRTFVSTWRMLFIVSTSAGFNDYLHASMQFDGVTGKLGTAFWIIFLCFSFFVLTNLMVSAVVSSYGTVFDSESSTIQLDTAETLIKLWNDFDSDGSGYLPVDKVSTLLSDLVEPLRVAEPNSAIVSMMEIPVSDNYRICHTDLVQALVKEIMQRTGDYDFEGEFFSSNLPGHPTLNTKIYRKLELASNFIKYCLYRKRLQVSYKQQ